MKKIKKKKQLRTIEVSTGNVLKYTVAAKY